MRRFRTKNLISEVNPIEIGGDQITVTPVTIGDIKGVNIKGGSIDKNYKVEADKMIDITVDIDDIKNVGDTNDLKIYATALGVQQDPDVLRQPQIEQIFKNIKANKTEFKISGPKNTFIFTQV